MQKRQRMVKRKGVRCLFAGTRPAAKEATGDAQDLRGKAVTREIDVASVERPQNSHELRYSVKDGLRQMAWGGRRHISTEATFRTRLFPRGNPRQNHAWASSSDAWSRVGQVCPPLGYARGGDKAFEEELA